MKIKINNYTSDAEYFSTPEELETGLMDRESLDGCAIFNVGNGHHSFWMKNCKIVLDIVFIQHNRITKIHLNCPPAGNKLNPPRYTGIGDYVIELPGNTAKNWKIGDRVFIF